MFGRRIRSSTCCWNSLAVSRIPATLAYARAPREIQLTLVFRRSHSAAVSQAVRNVTNLLGLDPDAKEFRIVYGAVPRDNKEIALVTRSIFEVLLDISSTIIVPDDARDGAPGVGHCARATWDPRERSRP